MSDLSRKVLDLSRVVLSLLVLGLLVTSVGSSADRLIGELIDEAALLSGHTPWGGPSLSASEPPEAVPENREKMDPSRRSQRHPAGSQIAPLIIQQDKPPTRLKADFVGAPESGTVATNTVSRRPILASSAAVNTSLGRQFTLVGSRPSGTS